MNDVTRQILLESNADLLQDVKCLINVLEQITSSPELGAYHESVYQSCQNLQGEIEKNFDEVKRRPFSSFRTLLSETQRLKNDFKFYNQHFAGPVRRQVPEDRLPLRILGWLYATHAVTRNIPAGLTNSEFRVWPQLDKPVLYGVPVSTQHGLLYQPLLFHEFGHQLFVCFENELGNYIRDLQRKIEALLTPWSQGSDKHADRDRSRRRDIVSTWYSWCEELFCDVIGLTIGGPAFLYALDRYVRISDKTEYHIPRDKLAYRDHPIFRLRMKLLIHQARALQCSPVADLVERNWEKLAKVLQTKEDYYGFYEEEYFPIIQEALKKMVQEVGPYQFTKLDLNTDEWTPTSTPVHLLNCAWAIFTTEPEMYSEWERKAIDSFCA